jgi:hypothetical protein
MDQGSQVKINAGRLRLSPPTIEIELAAEEVGILCSSIS